MKLIFLEDFSNMEKNETKEIHDITAKKLIQRGIAEPVDEELKKSAKKERTRIVRIEKKREKIAAIAREKVKKLEEKLKK